MKSATTCECPYCEGTGKLPLEPAAKLPSNYTTMKALAKRVGRTVSSLKYDHEHGWLTMELREVRIPFRHHKGCWAYMPRMTYCVTRKEADRYAAYVTRNRGTEGRIAKVRPRTARAVQRVRDGEQLERVAIEMGIKPLSLKRAEFRVRAKERRNQEAA